MVRSAASLPARALISAGHIRAGLSVLDYGCGHGADLSAYRLTGAVAQGFDPHFLPREFDAGDCFDVVTCVYVLNVLEPAERAAALAGAVDRVAPGGVLYVYTRTAQEIAKAAVTGKWLPAEDGFVTPAQTFQRGFADAELADLIRNAGLAVVPHVRCPRTAAAAGVTR